MEQNPVVASFLVIGVIVAAARVAGAISRRLNQPRVLGELVIGIILGPTMLDLLNISAFGLKDAHLQETIIELAELGVLLLMFKVGLEVHLDELARVGIVAGIAGILGALVPVALAIPVIMAYDYPWESALFAGVTLAATSVSISAQVLMELGLLRTKEGNALLATALIDDVVAILLVSITIPLTQSGESVEVGALATIVVNMVLYILIASVLSWYTLPAFMRWVHGRPEVGQVYGVPAFAFILALLFGWSAQHFGGVATITGAFIAGVGLSRTQETVRFEIDEAVSSIAYTFLVPIFFVSVGLQTDLSTFPISALPFATILLVVAVATKVLGCAAGGLLGGFSRIEALRLGVCMISRGEVGLIIAALGISTGIFTVNDPLFASLFMVIILTTVITPPFVRRVFQIPDRAGPYTDGVSAVRRG